MKLMTVQLNNEQRARIDYLLYDCQNDASFADTLSQCESSAELHAFAEQFNTDRQRSAFSRFYENQEALKPRLEDAIFTYYNTMQDVFREGYDPDFVDEDIPRLEESGEIWGLMSDLQVFIPKQAEGAAPWCIVLLWECTWEMEHGLGVRLLNGEVDEVGEQSIVQENM